MCAVRFIGGVFHLAVEQHAGLTCEAADGALQMIQLLTHRAEAGAIHAQAAIHRGLQLIQCLAAVGQGGNELSVHVVRGAATRGFQNIKAWPAMQTLAKTHPDGAAASCRPFSADRSGLVLAEGAGVLVLEAWEVAQRRGATILAELAGFGSSTDAHHLTQPHAPGQARAMRLALADAGLQPQDIGYLNAHGTATEVGDVVESEAIALAFGDAAGQLAVSSTKALHGHTLGAAGAIELIASLMALRNKQLPPTAFLDTPDPRCTLDYIPHTARPAPGLRAIMSNSFAFGGSNAVLVAKEACA